MDAALGWLGDIFRAILLIVPRIVVVRATHGGVRFRHGHKALEMNPGVHWYWPVVTEIEIVPVRDRALDLQQQYLETSDSQTIGLESTIKYEIHDWLAALTACYDYEEMIDNRGRAVIESSVTCRSFEQIKDGKDELWEEIVNGLQDELDSYGITVHSVDLTDLARNFGVALWGSVR